MSKLPSILAIALVAVIAVPVARARQETPTRPSNLEILGSSFGRIVSRTYIEPIPRDRFGNPRPRARGLPPPRVLIQREAYVLVRNVGTRTVVSVDWSFVFYADAKREQVIGRHSFKSKETVRPGEMKFISEKVKEGSPSAFETVTIDRVEFDDGSFAAP